MPLSDVEKHHQQTYASSHFTTLANVWADSFTTEEN